MHAKLVTIIFITSKKIRLSYQAVKSMDKPGSAGPSLRGDLL